MSASHIPTSEQFRDWYGSITDTCVTSTIAWEVLW